MKNEHLFAIVNVFSNSASKALGNPCAVILLDEELSSKELQAIAAELSQPATTFLWKTRCSDEFKVRWFAPDDEIELCGHGAMAACIFLSEFIHDLTPENNFKLIRERTIIEAGMSVDRGHFIKLEHIERSTPQKPPKELEKALGVNIVDYYHTDNKQIVLLDSEHSLAAMSPNFDALKNINIFGYAVTAPSSKSDDFVCRTLVPQVQQLEDHATGSTQAILVDFWAKILNKSELRSRQLSPRGGSFYAIHTENHLQLFAQSNFRVKGTICLT